MKAYWADEWTTDNAYNIAHDMRWAVATDIIRHAALVAGRDDGEDSAGRAKLGLMPAHEVAARALDIADAMVSGAEERGWFRPATVTNEQRARYAGLLEKVRLYGGYANEKDEKIDEIMKVIAALTASPA
jgi:hypothetical protein